MNKLQNQESPLSGHIIHFTLVNYRSSTLLSTLENFSKKIPEITSFYKQIKTWSIYPPAAFFHRLEIAYMGLLNSTHLLRTTYSDANIVLVILEKALQKKEDKMLRVWTGSVSAPGKSGLTRTAYHNWH